MYKYFISLRYIKSRLITWFSIAGIAIGVMVLVVVLSVMDGFRKEFISRLQGILSHIIVSVRNPELNYDALEKKIAAEKYVRACAPHLRGVVLIGTERYYVGGIVVGIDYQKESEVGKLADYMVTARRELKLWGEQLLENNIKLPHRIEVSWEVLGGKAVPAEGRFPAGTRLICRQIFKIIPKEGQNLPGQDKPYLKKQLVAYTIDESQPKALPEIVFMERNLPSNYAEKVPKLLPITKRKWDRYFAGMADRINSRDLTGFIDYYSKNLRFAAGSLDPKNPFQYESADSGELDIRPVIVGYELLRQLGMRRGEEITLMTGRRNPKDGKLKPYGRKFVVVGSFKSGWQEIDAHMVYTRRSDLKEFIDIANDVNEISVALDAYRHADLVKQRLDFKLNKDSAYSYYQKPYPVEKWEDRRKTLLSAINLERLIMAIIVSLIVVLAVVSIMIILILLVTEKTKDIGILKSMGATDRGIMSIFVFNGAFISLLGAALGSGLGVLFSLNINSIADIIFESTGFRLFPRDVYYLDRIPTELSVYNIAIITGGTVILALLACSIPAFKAARMDAVEALNSEAPSLNWWRRKRQLKITSKAPDIFFGVQGLVREYIMGHQKLRVLDNVNLTIREGEILVILGSSGAGKSTLLHLMGLLDTPNEGGIYHRGCYLSSFPPDAQAKVRNHDIGFVFQFYHLLPELTALENVLLGAMIRYSVWEWLRYKKQMIAQAKEILIKVGLGQRLSHKPVELSGGERQRVAIARALVNKPRIVLCDEPTGNLDEDNSVAIHNLIWELNEQLHQTFVIVTHEERMARKGDRIFRLQHGKLFRVENGAKEEGQAEAEAEAI